MSAPRWAAGLGLLVVAIFVSPAAGAYLHVTTDEGIKAHWTTHCVEHWLHVGETSPILWEDAEAASLAAYQTWSSIPGLGVEFRHRGATCVGEVGEDDEPGARNVIRWRHTWPYPERVVAFTSLTYSNKTGRIVDADVEMNAEDFLFGVVEAPGTWDVQQALTHEAGHVLGLAHSGTKGAVMHSKGEDGDISKRTLTQDDIDGVLESHPPDAFEAGTECVQPPNGLYPRDEPWCPEWDSGGGGGGCAGGLPGSGAPWPLAAWAMLALFGLTERRSRRSRALLSLALGLLLASSSSSACRATPALESDNGKPLRWTTTEHVVQFDPDLPDYLLGEQEAVMDSFAYGFRQWTDLDCSEQSVDLEPMTPCPGDGMEDGFNCVFWVHDQERFEERFQFGSHTVSNALVHHVIETGEIVDVDVAFNGAIDNWVPWTKCASACGDACEDFQCDGDCDFGIAATMTHEAGHYFGLGHQSVKDATMGKVTFPGDCKKRTLLDADIECFCSHVDQPLEPDEADVVEADHVLHADPPPESPKDKGGCSNAPEPAGGGAPAGGPLVLLLALLSLGRLRRARRSTG